MSQDDQHRVPSRREQRRAEIEAGGALDVDGFVEMPAGVGPADIAAWIGMMEPEALDAGESSTTTTSPAAGKGAATGAGAGFETSAPEADYQPMTRREARRLREQREREEQAARAQVASADPAEAGDGVPTQEQVEAEERAITEEALAIGELIAQQDTATATTEAGETLTVDPDLQARQEALAERAGRLQELRSRRAAVGQVDLEAGADRPSETVAGTDPVRQEPATAPVAAQDANGLDSLAVSQATSQDRRMRLLVGIAVVVALIALVILLITLTH